MCVRRLQDLSGRYSTRLHEVRDQSEITSVRASVGERRNPTIAERRACCSTCAAR